MSEIKVGSSRVSPEIALVLRCAMAGADNTIVVQPEYFDAVRDWPAVFVIVAQNAIASLVARSIDRGPTAVIPSFVREQFREIARESAIRGLQFASELLNVLSELDRAAVSCVPFKGPTLAMLLYADLSLRAYEDLDMLVHEEQLERAISALTELGYRFNDALTVSQRRTLVADAYHVGFLHPVSGINIELHWLLNHRTLTYRELERDWWASSQCLTIGGTVVRTLGPEELILYLCMHGGKHSWGRLNWICDLRQCLLRFPEAKWESIWHRADKNGVARMVTTGLALVEALLDGSSLTSRPFAGRPEDPLAQQLVSTIIERFMGPGTSPRDADFVMQLRLRERFRDRVGYAAHVLTAPHQADVAQLGLPPSLRRMYYLLRPARLAWKHMRLRAHRSNAA